MTSRQSSPPYPSILRMAAPLVLSFGMRSLFTFVDIAFASRLGDAAIAAVGGLSFPYEILMIACWVGVSTGLTSNLSQAMGKRQGARIEQILSVSRGIVWSLVPLFSAIAVYIYFGAYHMGLDPVLARQFSIYGGVLIGGSAFTAFWSIIPDSIVKAHHDTKSTMWAGIWSNLINVGLNTLFLFVFHWGVFGIALSTVLGRFGGLVYALRKAARHEAARQASGLDTDPTLDPHPLRSFLSLALPSSMTYGLMAVETGLVNWLLARQPNATESIAAYGIYSRVLQFAAMPIIAAAVAVLPYVARRFGEGNIRAIRDGMRQILLVAVVYCVGLVTPALLVGGPWLARALAESPLTAELATMALALCPLACLAMVPFSLCRPAFEGLQRGRPGLAMAVFRYTILTIPFAFAGMKAADLLGRPPLHGLIAGLIGASGLASAVFFIWMRRFLGDLEAQERAAAPQPRPAGQPGAARFSAPATLPSEPTAPLSARQDAPED
ncbi:MAG TPA: MATE family efflux transporter [Candidatus Dormibacteraeota bacterium]|nr:MATE family efflux transporter [Candidatus Dormibacteraeota bacterium]